MSSPCRDRGLTAQLCRAGFAGCSPFETTALRSPQGEENRRSQPANPHAEEGRRPVSKHDQPPTGRSGPLSLWGSLLALTSLAVVTVSPVMAEEAGRELRVCADPSNLPFSNNRLEGFENKIVAVLAADLKAEVRYVWWAQRRGFIRNTLNENLCDLIPGIASGVERVATTRPYYRSGYVFVSRGGGITSLDDPGLRDLTIGVQMIGDDFANTPPAHALSRRGLVGNVRGYSVLGDYAAEDRLGKIVEAVSQGEIDLAVVWGPVAGFYARRQSGLTLAPVSPRMDGPTLPMVFDISMAVRRDDTARHAEIDGALRRKRAEIDDILAQYGVPRLDPPRTGRES